MATPMEGAKTAEYIGPWNAKRGSAMYPLCDTPTTSPLTKEDVGSMGEELAPEDLDLDELPELEPGINSFLTRSVESSEEEESPSRTTSWGIM